MDGEQQTVQVERSERQTRRYSKRVILVFLILVGGIIAAITMQAQFKIGGISPQEQNKNYRTPQASGFAELATGMRRDRQPAPIFMTSPDEPKVPEPQRIVIERTIKAERPLSPRYYSNKDDAQAASTLRTLKLQALASKPLVEDFKQDSGEGKVQRANAENGTMIRGVSGNAAPQGMDSTSMAALMQQGTPPTDPNGQAQKQNFLRGADGGSSLTPQGYSRNVPIPQQFPYELKAGTVIPGILLSGINSDLPGNVLAQVSENIWDTSSGKYVLIPKGTKILGVYDSQVRFGQKRVLLVWNRLLFPNGTTLDIAGSPGVDMAGYSGLSGRVNEHWGKMFATALIASLFVTGAEVVYDKDTQGNNEKKSPRDAAAESLAGSILDMGTKIMDKASDIQPTITIRPGKRMGIFVQQDIAFPYPYF